MAKSSAFESRTTAREELCERHGPFQAEKLFGAVWSRCPACSEERARVRERMEAEAAERRMQDLQDRWLLESGLRGRFAQATFGAYRAGTSKQAAVLKACQLFVERFEPDAWRPLWLIGPPGTGKTHLGAGAVQACIAARRMRALIATPREIVRELRATWRRDSSLTEEDVIEVYASVPLLVLDEVGVGFGSDGELVQLFEVIDRRYQLNRSVILISNLSAAELRGALGDRLFDRLRDGAKVLLCDWASHRGRSLDREADK